MFSWSQVKSQMLDPVVLKKGFYRHAKLWNPKTKTDAIKRFEAIEEGFLLHLKSKWPGGLDN